MGLRSLLGQVRDLWDLAGELVELRESLDATDREVARIDARLTTIDDRTRKQKQRAEQGEEEPAGAPPFRPNGAPDHRQILAAARARGII